MHLLARRAVSAEFSHMPSGKSHLSKSQVSLAHAGKDFTMVFGQRIADGTDVITKCLVSTQLGP